MIKTVPQVLVWMAVHVSMGLTRIRVSVPMGRFNSVLQFSQLDLDNSNVDLCIIADSPEAIAKHELTNAIRVLAPMEQLASTCWTITAAIARTATPVSTAKSTWTGARTTLAWMERTADKWRTRSNACALLVGLVKCAMSRWSLVTTLPSGKVSISRSPVVCRKEQSWPINFSDVRRELLCNNGTCEDIGNSHRCHCHEGYTGSYCANEIKYCESAPCQNGATCKDFVGGYNCVCPVGFQGPNCEFNIDDCRPNPCQNGGTCLDLVNNVACSCPPGKFDWITNG